MTTDAIILKAVPVVDARLSVRKAMKSVGRRRTGRQKWSITHFTGQRRAAEIDDAIMKMAALRLFKKAASFLELLTYFTTKTLHHLVCFYQDLDQSGTISRSEYEAVLGFEKLNTDADSILSKVAMCRLCHAYV
jgi:hypothetical protein